MSSAGRSDRLGGELDIYPTPAWAVHRLLDSNVPLRPGLWLEPCAGYGAIIRAVEGHPATRGRVLWRACEIRPEVEGLLTKSLESTGSPGPVIADFLTLEQDRLRECTVVLTNPPFSLAEQFLLKCMALAPLATVVFLLRSNFIGGEERCQWLRDHVPDTYALPNRPQFRGEGSDSTEYSWMVWEPGAISKVRRRGYHEILEETPLAVRRRDKEEAISLLAGVEFVQREVQLGLGGLG
jgi:hypothetical protein